MSEDACILNAEQRALVNKTVEDHRRLRGWKLYAVNCRSNHLHLVVGAHLHPDRMRAQFKAWCTRRLKEFERKRLQVIDVRTNWWAERGSRRYINDEASLAYAIAYVNDGQDYPRQRAVILTNSGGSIKPR